MKNANQISVMKNLFLTFFLLSTCYLYGQSLIEIPLNFIPKFKGQNLSLETNYQLNKTDSCQIEIFKCYLSNFKLYDGENLVYSEADSYHLLDVEAAASLNFTLDIPENTVFSHIEFNLGIDSLTNMAGVMGGDLDPTKGMYWTWQSGYINYKLEGKSNLCDNRNNSFVYHLGGYAFPNNSIQKVRLKIKKEDKNQPILIAMNVDQFLEKIDLTAQSHVMSLGKAAIELAEQAAQIFSISE